jgi:hypothetical protein
MPFPYYGYNSAFPAFQAWKQVATLIKIQGSREIKGILHQQTRYYINDEEVVQPAYYNSFAREH